MFELDRWNAAWKDVDARPPKDLLGELVARYSAPERAYHTLQHLGECFRSLDSVRALAIRPAEVELALWFHDAIYDVRGRDNEAQSAQWAEQSLVVAGASELAAGRVRDLVLATRHDAVPVDPDARLLVDIDLSILGTPEPRFSEYERQVRREYAWVPEPAFREGRSRVLSSFLDRPAIYGTPWFAARLEAQARANLERSLRELAAS